MPRPPAFVRDRSHRGKYNKDQQAFPQNSSIVSFDGLGVLYILGGKI
jgi:hypothetical protein